MGLFSNLKRLRLKDIGTGKNLKKVRKGLKQMKFGEGLGLLGLGLGGAGLFGAGPLGGMLGGTGQAIGGFGKAGFQKIFGQGIGTDIAGKTVWQPGFLNSPEAMSFYKKQAKGLLGQAIPGGQMPPQMMNMPQFQGMMPQLQNMMPTAGLQIQENLQSAVNPSYIGQTYENPMAAQQAGGYQDSIFNMLNKIQ